MTNLAKIMVVVSVRVSC